MAEVYGTYGFALTGNTINTVRVRIDANCTVNDKIKVEFTVDGTNYDADTTTLTLTTLEATYWWNITALETWTPAKLNDTNFKVRVTEVKYQAQDIVRLDWIPVEVKYTAPQTYLREVTHGVTLLHQYPVLKTLNRLASHAMALVHTTSDSGSAFSRILSHQPAVSSIVERIAAFSRIIQHNVVINEIVERIGNFFRDVFHQPVVSHTSEITKIEAPEEGWTIDPGWVFDNDVMSLNCTVQPNLNVTQIILTNQTLQFSDKWFNLTHTGGKVFTNLTYWEPQSVNRTTFLIQNSSLTALKVWMNGTKPTRVYLDGVPKAEGDTWNYVGSVIRVNATTARNVTLWWGAVGGIPYSREVGYALDLSHTGVAFSSIFGRQVSHTPLLTSTTEKVSTFLRTIENQLQISHLIESMRSLLIQLSHSLSLSHVVARTGDFARTSIHSPAISHLVERIATLTITIQHQPALIHSVEAIKALLRQAYSSIVMIHDINRVVNFVRESPHQIVISSVVERITSSIRTVEYQIAINHTIELATSILRQALNAIMINHDVARTGIFQRESSHSPILLHSVSDAGSTFVRTLAHSINLQETIDTLKSLLIQVSHSLTLDHLTERISVFSRESTHSPVITYLSERIVTFSRIVVHNPIINHAVESLTYLQREAVNLINITHIASRIGAFGREVIHQPVIQHILDIVHTAGYVPQTYTRIVTNFPALLHEASRIGSFLRTTTHQPLITAVVEQALYIARTITNYLTMLHNVDRTGTFMREVTHQPVISALAEGTKVIIRDVSHIVSILHDIVTAITPAQPGGGPIIPIKFGIGYVKTPTVTEGKSTVIRMTATWNNSETITIKSASAASPYDSWVIGLVDLNNPAIQAITGTSTDTYLINFTSITTSKTTTVIITGTDHFTTTQTLTSTGSKTTQQTTTTTTTTITTQGLLTQALLTKSNATFGILITAPLGVQLGTYQIEITVEAEGRGQRITASTVIPLTVVSEVDYTPYLILIILAALFTIPPAAKITRRRR